MKKDFLLKIEKILLDKRHELLNKVVVPVDIDLDGDETDEIQGNLLLAINSKLSKMDSKNVESINNALLKIKTGSFGICENCEEEISEKRLLVNPIFEHCIMCAEELEIENKRNKRL